MHNKRIGRDDLLKIEVRNPCHWRVTNLWIYIFIYHDSGPALRHRHRGGLILTELRGGAVASRPEDVPSLLLAGILPHLKIVTMTVIEEIAPRALTHGMLCDIYSLMMLTHNT
jgi:hypothetical protein